MEHRFPQSRAGVLLGLLLLGALAGPGCSTSHEATRDKAAGEDATTPDSPTVEVPEQRSFQDAKRILLLKRCHRKMIEPVYLVEEVLHQELDATDSTHTSTYVVCALVRHMGRCGWNSCGPDYFILFTSGLSPEDEIPRAQIVSALYKSRSDAPRGFRWSRVRLSYKGKVCKWGKSLRIHEIGHDERLKKQINWELQRRADCQDPKKTCLPASANPYSKRPPGPCEAIKEGWNLMRIKVSTTKQPDGQFTFVFDVQEVLSTQQVKEEN